MEQSPGKNFVGDTVGNFLNRSFNSVCLGPASGHLLGYQGPLEIRVEDLLGRFNQDAKLGLLGGPGFTTQPIPRLSVPVMAMADAGQGVRGGADSTLGSATTFPAGVLVASTWDTNSIWQIGHTIGEEAGQVLMPRLMSCSPVPQSSPWNFQPKSINSFLRGPSAAKVIMDRAVTTSEQIKVNRNHNYAMRCLIDQVKRDKRALIKVSGLFLKHG